MLVWSAVSQMTPQQFREARRELGLSQIKLAKALQVTERTVRRYEYGEVEIPGPVEVLIDLWLSDL